MTVSNPRTLLQGEYVSLEAMRATLKANGLTYYDIADETGLSERTIGRQLRGQTPLQVAVLCMVAELCNTSPADFLKQREWETPALGLTARDAA